MAGTLSPSPYITIFDANGDPISGGKIFSYESGTSTPLAIYTDADLQVAWANPAVADSAGRITAYLLPAAYKFEIADASGVVFDTVDPVGSVPSTAVSLDVDIVAGEALTANDAIYQSTGGGGDPGTAGRWYKTDSDTAYASVSALLVGVATTDIASAASGTARLQGTVTGFVGLTPGAWYYLGATAGGITASAPTNARTIGQADSATTLVVALGPPVATSAISGLVSLTTQTLGAGTKSVDKLTYKPGAVTTFDARAMGSILGPYVTPVATSGTSETSTIATPPTLKANTLNASGDKLRAVYIGIASANAQARTWTFKLGGTSITTLTFTPNATAASWRLTIEIERTSGATAQDIFTTLEYTEAGSAGTTRCDYQAATKDLSTALTFDVTMTNAVAGTITFKSAAFELVPQV